MYLLGARVSYHGEYDHVEEDQDSWPADVLRGRVSMVMKASRRILRPEPPEPAGETMLPA